MSDDPRTPPVDLTAYRAARSHAAGHEAHDRGEAFAFALWEYDGDAVGLIDGEPGGDALVSVLFDKEHVSGVAMSLDAARRLLADLAMLLVDPTIDEEPTP